jgi:hypothetical protein
MTTLQRQTFKQYFKSNIKNFSLKTQRHRKKQTFPSPQVSFEVFLVGVELSTLVTHPAFRERWLVRNLDFRVGMCFFHMFPQRICVCVRVAAETATMWPLSPAHTQLLGI